jgi:excisionase family DNA binding protein
MPAKPAGVAEIVKDAAAAAGRPPRPTLNQIKRWPPTCTVADAAAALGVATSTAYQWVKEGRFPVATISVGRRRIRTQVVTAALVRLLEGKAA